MLTRTLILSVYGVSGNICGDLWLLFWGLENSCLGLRALVDPKQFLGSLYVFTQLVRVAEPHNGKQTTIPER